jgi:hypothetical protein
MSPIGSILPFCFPILPEISAFIPKNDKKDLKQVFFCTSRFSWYWSSNAFSRPAYGSRMYKDNKKNEIKRRNCLMRIRCPAG